MRVYTSPWSAGLTLRRRLASASFLSCLAAAPAFPADSVLSPERQVSTLAEGVYEIRHKDPFPGWVHGNTTVVVGDREVLVVDSCSSAAAAREDIAQIRRWTSRPVRYLVNTHWHQDHNAGNQEYAEAFPGLAILAHAATKEMEDATAANVPADITRDATDTKARLEKKIATGKSAEGKILTEAETAEAAQLLVETAGLLEQARVYVYRPPTLTFRDALTVDLGGREVEVRHGGRGNTAGDVFVYLPRERILATGDLLVRPVPYAFDGYPTEWIRTLQGLAALDADTIVPGHGELMHDKSYLMQVIGLMKSVVSQVDAQLRRNSDVSLAEVTKAVDLKAFREAMLGGDARGGPFFDYSIGAKFVELAYHELKQR
jgi:glyoxylase-like metal-dependent hydrolase (beta-lactamase superfamily II)